MYVQLGFHDPNEDGGEVILVSEPEPRTEELLKAWRLAIEIHNSKERDDGYHYVLSVYEVERPRLQLGLFDPCDESNKVRTIGQPREDSMYTRLLFHGVIRQFNLGCAHDINKRRVLSVFLVHEPEAVTELELPEGGAV